MVLFEPVDNLTKLYIPLWWYGQVAKIDDHSPAHCDLTPSGAYFKESGYCFDSTDDYLIDADGRKVLADGTEGEWSSIFLTDGNVPRKGSVQGTGTKLYLNVSGAAPKITGKVVLCSRYCPNILRLYCYDNSISELGIGDLTSLTYLYCKTNSISVLDVSALTGLVYLNCMNNSISVLDVSALTGLGNLYCNSNSISVLDVSALTGLLTLVCYSNSISVLDVSALTSLATLQCQDNSMNQAMVDTVLCDMDGHGTNNGTLNISDNAVPSATGIACKNNLVGRGWTVTTD
jgi:Leucine-rich repeat (LRR) protein